MARAGYESAGLDSTASLLLDGKRGRVLLLALPVRGVEGVTAVASEIRAQMAGISQAASEVRVPDRTGPNHGRTIRHPHENQPQEGWWSLPLQRSCSASVTLICVVTSMLAVRAAVLIQEAGGAAALLEVDLLGCCGPAAIFWSRALLASRAAYRHRPGPHRRFLPAAAPSLSSRGMGLSVADLQQRDGLFGRGHGAVESDHRTGTRLRFGGDDGDVVVGVGDNVAEPTHIKVEPLLRAVLSARNSALHQAASTTGSPAGKLHRSESQRGKTESVAPTGRTAIHALQELTQGKRAAACNPRSGTLCPDSKDVRPNRRSRISPGHCPHKNPLRYRVPTRRAVPALDPGPGLSKGGRHVASQVHAAVSRKTTSAFLPAKAPHPY